MGSGRGRDSRRHVPHDGGIVMPRIPKPKRQAIVRVVPSLPPLPEVTTDVVEALGELVRHQLRDMQLPNPWLNRETTGGAV